jgi:PAS domain S-box-containing protein
MRVRSTLEELEQKAMDLEQLTSAFKQAERALRETGRKRRALTHSLPIGVMTVDTELRITELNPWGEALTGYAQNEVVGKHCKEILQGEMCGSSHCPLKSAVDSTRTVVRMHTSIRTKQGNRIPIRSSTAGLFDDEGRLLGGVKVFQDSTEIEAFARQRSNLISMFAHDMKSPLVAIQGFAQRMLKKRDALTPEKHSAYLEIIAKEAEKLEHLVSDFLDFTCMEAGFLKLNFGPVNLDQELLELAEVYQSRFADAGVTLKLADSKKLTVIEADAYNLRRVFTNLLDNALKFSPSGTVVTIRAEENDQEIVVQVHDQGMGIPPEEVPFIFNPFYQGWGERKKRGYGLGLAGVDAIVKGHGGRVLVTSQMHKGSVFTIILPKRRPYESGKAPPDFIKPDL